MRKIKVHLTETIKRKIERVVHMYSRIYAVKCYQWEEKMMRGEPNRSSSFLRSSGFVVEAEVLVTGLLHLLLHLVNILVVNIVLSADAL